MRETSVDHQFSIPNPKLWSPDSPSLYTAVTEVKVAGKVVDRYETVFGLSLVPLGFRYRLLFE